MKKSSILFLILVSTFVSYAQYWQQRADYVLDVTLNESLRSLQGFARITYTNNSPDTLRFLWFHLWPNAYKNDRTAFSDGLLEAGNTDFYFSDKEDRGYINQLQFKAGGVVLKTEDHPQHIDITKVWLASPLPPGGQVLLTTPFHVKLPRNVSRGGYYKNTFQVTQWYPKPAVYDAKGWHPMPYLDQGEFYSEFGDYDVRITVPGSYVVAATGQLQNEEERAWLKTRTQGPAPNQPARKTGPAKPPKPSPTTGKGSITARQQATQSVRKTAPATPASIAPTAPGKTLRFTQSNVHDFAWFANPAFIVTQDTCRLPSGKVIQLASYYTQEQRSLWDSSLHYMKDAVRFYSRTVGDYLYQTVTAVQGVGNYGGMEYPTITQISPVSSAKELDVVLAHEIGHNWFYGILATNERDYPWMDEGINTYYERRYTAEKYATYTPGEALLLHTAIRKHRDQPIETAAADFTTLNYGLVAYYKTARWLEGIQQQLGRSTFDTALQAYFREWQFRHPQPADFKKILARYTSQDTAALFAPLSTTGPLPGDTLTGFTLLTPFKPRSFRQYLQQPTRKALLLSPAVGYNKYDGAMIGGLVSNYSLPPASLQFLVAPLYATTSKTVNGLGRLSYTTYPTRGLQSASLFVAASRFSQSSFTDNRNTTHYFGFQKWAPGFELVARERSLKSTRQRALQGKSFFINEEQLRFSVDTVVPGPNPVVVDVVNKGTLNYAIHQLKATVEDHRALYPYTGTVTAQVSHYFARLGAEGTYFFNYKDGGLQVRVFAGKFFFRNGRSYPYGYDINRFALNLTGPNGSEDYTYNDYFIGRNAFEGLASRQLAIRDGGFKIRTDLLSSKVGKTGDWLAATNFTTTIPRRINPFSLLPISIPLRLFADIGTYSEAWNSDGSADRFLFDAGFQLSLFKETINVYFPVVYSPVFRDYVKSIYPKNRFWQTASFSIRLNNAAREIRKQLP